MPSARPSWQTNEEILVMDSRNPKQPAGCLGDLLGMKYYPVIYIGIIIGPCKDPY